MNHDVTANQPRKRRNRQRQKPAARKGQPVRSPGKQENDSEDLTQYVQLSAPAVDWAMALGDPFGAEPAGVPDFPATKSRKVKAFAKTTMTIPAGGIGFAAMNPASGVVNDAVFVFSTTAAFAGAGFDLNAATAGVITANGNSEYLFAGFGPGINMAEFRVVGSGLRVRNTTPNLSRGGSLVALQEPRHSSLHTRTFAQLDADVQSGKFELGSLGANWINVLYRPLVKSDVEYAETFPTYTPAPTDPSFYVGVIGTSPVAQTLDVEAYTIFEVQGTAIRGVTISHNDPNGFAAVQAAAALHPHVFRPFAGSSSGVAASLTRAAASYMMNAHSRVAHKKDKTKKKKKKKNKGGNFLDDLITSGIGALLDFFF